MGRTLAVLLAGTCLYTCACMLISHNKLPTKCMSAIAKLLLLSGRFLYSFLQSHNLSPPGSPSTQISWASANLDLPSGNHTGLGKATHLGWGIAVSCNSSEKSVLGKTGICRTAEADMSWYETMSNKLSSAKAECSYLAHCHHNALDPVYWPLYIVITEEEWTAASCAECKRSRKKKTVQEK